MRAGYGSVTARAAPRAAGHAGERAGGEGGEGRPGVGNNELYVNNTQSWDVRALLLACGTRLAGVDEGKQMMRLISVVDNTIIQTSLPNRPSLSLNPSLLPLRKTSR